MSQKTNSTRRAFLKGGALAAAPLAAAGASAVVAKSEHEARIERLQAEAALRDLHQAWLRKVNTGAETGELFADPKQARPLQAVTRVDADHAAAPDEVSLHPGGLTASGRYACVVETGVEIAPDCTLAQMRHAQGEGQLRQSERRLLEADYVKTQTGWAIVRLTFEPA